MAERIVKSRHGSQDVNRIRLQIYEPAEEVRGWVHSYWTAETDNTEEADRFRVANNCGTGWIFIFCGVQTFRIREQVFSFGAGAVRTGPSRYVCEHGFLGPVRALGVRFLPRGGHLFLPKPLDGLRDGIEPLDEPDLEATLSRADLQTSVQVLEAELARRIGAAQSEISDPDQVLLDAVLSGFVSGNYPNTEDAARHLGTNTRRIQRVFQRLVGISPSAFLHNHRILRAKETLAKATEESLTDLAYEFGYFDQAHFIKEFRSMIEESPGAYRKLKRGGSG